MYNFWQSPMLSPVTPLFFVSRSLGRKKAHGPFFNTFCYLACLMRSSSSLELGRGSWTHIHGSVLRGQREACEKGNLFQERDACEAGLTICSWESTPIGKDKRGVTGSVRQSHGHICMIATHDDLILFFLLVSYGLFL